MLALRWDLQFGRGRPHTRASVARQHEKHKISAGDGPEAEQHLQPVDDCLAPERIHGLLVDPLDAYNKQIQDE